MPDTKRPLYEGILKRLGEDELDIIKRVISNYTFIDYGLVQSYQDGLVEVVLAHTLLNKEVRLINIETLSFGSKGLSTTYELVKGDIVQLVSSKCFIECVAGLVSASQNSVLPYTDSTIKAIPLANPQNSKNKLQINADGSWSLTGESYSIVATTEGILQLNGDSKSFMLWDAFNTIYQSLITTLKNHSHPTDGAVSPGLATLSNDLSTVKTTTVKTNG